MKKMIILIALLLTACNDMDSMRMPSEQSPTELQGIY